MAATLASRSLRPVSNFPRLFPVRHHHAHSARATPFRWIRRHGPLFAVSTAATVGVSIALIPTPLRVRAEGNPWELTPRPEAVPSRRLDYGLDLGVKITLYQYQTCPFCCKVRAFLDYYGISYDVVEVNSVRRTELKWSKYPKVPILIVETPDGKSTQINDSSQIISVMRTFIDNKLQIPIHQLVKYYPHFEEKTEGTFADKTSYDFPNKYFMMYFDEPADSVSETTAKKRSIERKWRSWVDSNFVHRISPNIYRTFRESFGAFRYFEEVGEWSKTFSWLDRLVIVYCGGFVMRIVASNLKTKHNLDDDVREELYVSTRRFIKKALKGRKFVGGDSVTLADLALYGSMTSFEGCEAFADLTANTDVGAWFAAVKAAVTAHEGQRALRDMVREQGGSESTDVEADAESACLGA